MNGEKVMNSLKKWTFEQWEEIIIGVLFGIALSVFLWQAYAVNLNIDEREHVASARMVYVGMVPYRDFFQHHHPLMWYVLAPFFAICGNSAYIFIFMRGIMLLFSVGTLWYIYKIGLILGLKKRLAVCGVIMWLAVPIVLKTAIEIRPDNMMIPFIMAGLYYFLRYLKEKNGLCLILSFMLFFISLLFLQKALFLLAPLGLVSLGLLYKKEIKWGDLLKAAVLPLLLLAFGLGMLYICGGLRRYWELNWLLNLKIGLGTLLEEHEFYIFWVMAVVAIWLMYRHRQTLIWVFCLLYLLAASEMLVRTPLTTHYLLIYYLFVAVMLAFLLAELRCFKAVYVAILLMIGVELTWQGVYRFEISRHDRYGRVDGADVRWAKFILENTTEDDLFFGREEECGTGLRLPAGGYYWYSFSVMSAMDEYYFKRYELPDVAEVIRNKRPKIIAGGWWQNCGAEEIISSADRCYIWRNFDWEYLRENYVDLGFVFMRKD